MNDFCHYYESELIFLLSHPAKSVASTPIASQERKNQNKAYFSGSLPLCVDNAADISQSDVQKSDSLCLLLGFEWRQTKDDRSLPAYCPSCFPEWKTAIYLWMYVPEIVLQFFGFNGANREKIKLSETFPDTICHSGEFGKL